MADMDLEHSGLQEVANAMREENEGPGHTQKRKRDSESADDTRRGNKRVSPNNTGNKAGDGHQQDGVEALQDYNSLHHQHHDQNGSAEHASSTAAAALAGIYPTMTIPQPTDVSFATQGSDDRNPDSSFMDNSQQGGDSFMENSTPSGRGSGSKPAVGSDEWHKVRKDNHKEGKS
jgi:transcriptional regulator CBF1